MRVLADHSEILVIPASGGPEKKIGEIARGTGISWTPDSRNLVVSQVIQEESGLFLWSLSSGDKLRLTSYPASGDGGDKFPAASSDGRNIVFSRGPTGSGELYILRLTPDWKPEGEPRRLTHDNGLALRAAWTASGREVIYDLRKSPLAQALNRISADGAGVSSTPVEGLGRETAFPEISRKGDKLAFARSTSDQNIWTTHINGGQGSTPVRTIATTSRDYEPRLSPDGARVVFSSDRTGYGEVWISDSDGSNPKQLTHLARFTGGARFSPNGRAIVFLSMEGDQQELFTMPAEGGVVTRLTNNPAHDTAPSWSPDGKTVYFASNRGGDFQVWSMPAAGGSAHQITRKGGYGALTSMDGKYLYYTTYTNPPQLWRVPVDGGEEVGVLPAIDSWGNFAVVESGIYYVPPQKKEIDFYDFGSRKSTLVRALEKRPEFGLTATPDGKTLLFTQVDRESTELMLLENFK
jgi:Tol biopolymer transport system component